MNILCDSVISHILSYVNMKDAIYFITCSKIYYELYNNVNVWNSKLCTFDPKTYKKLSYEIGVVERLIEYLNGKKRVPYTYPPVGHLIINMNKVYNEPCYLSFVIQHTTQHFQSLRKLSIVNFIPSDYLGLSSLQKLPLRELTICSIAQIGKPFDALFLCGMQLEKLELTGMYITEDKHLSKLTSLTHLILRNKYHEDDSLKKLEGLNLKVLEIYGPTEQYPIGETFFCAITNMGMKMIAQFPLKKLVLAHVNMVTDVGVSYLTQLTQLESLSFSWMPHLTDNILTYISQISSLRELRLCNCMRLVGYELDKLSSLQHLEILDLSGNYHMGSYIVEKLQCVLSLKYLVMKTSGVLVVPANKTHYTII